MIIIVDGYNVLKQMHSDKEIDETTRRAFASALGRYGKRKDHTIILVFDGGPAAWPTRAKIHGVEVIYAGFKDSADDFIIDYIQRKKGQMMLVSSDHQLCNAAYDMQIPSINAVDFYHLLLEQESDEITKKKQGPLVKITQASQPEVDVLMEQASVLVLPKQEEEAPIKASPKKKLSREERKLMQKVKKL